MKLPIEEWLNNQDFNSNIKELFKEGIICYKASAYRAALMFSYLGFQSVIKDRILKSEKPDNIHQKAWDKIKGNLRNEDTWDAEVNECIKKSDDQKRIFSITEDLRQQALFWKYRRNDCAHSKPNIIDYSHVEAFWSFLYSNLPKFVVNVSMESLLEKIERHFDPNYTSYDSDFSYLIEEINGAVSQANMEVFLQKLNSIFNENTYFGYTIFAERELKFWNLVIKLGSPITEIVIEFLKRPENETLLLSILDNYPKNILIFYASDPQGVRNLWRTKHSTNAINVYKLLASLLRNNLIIEKEKSEVFRHIISNSNKLYLEMDKSTFNCLNEHGYFKMYKDNVFGWPNLLSNIEWSNKNRITISFYLDSFGLDKQVVICLNDTLNTQPFPLKLKESLIEYFSIYQDKKERYIEICSQLGITPTENLGF